MKNVYKIEYRGTTYDCWGRSEWDYWRNYENKVYKSDYLSQATPLPAMAPQGRG